MLPNTTVFELIYPVFCIFVLFGSVGLLIRAGMNSKVSLSCDGMQRAPSVNAGRWNRGGESVSAAVLVCGRDGRHSSRVFDSATYETSSEYRQFKKDGIAVRRWFVTSKELAELQRHPDLKNLCPSCSPKTTHVAKVAAAVSKGVKRGNRMMEQLALL